METFLSVLAYMGIPSAVTGLIFWLIKRKLDKAEKKNEEREQKREEREKNTEKLILLIMQTGRANNVLAEATARAVQRIPAAECNGDMKRALEKAREFQQAEKDFILNKGLEHIFES